MSASPGKVHILARGADFIIASKPSGLPTSGRTLDDPDCLQFQLMTHLRRRKVWAVHQLDKGTSGACIFALKKASVALWADRLKAGRKIYLALCEGRLSGTHEVRAPIGRVRLPTGHTQPALMPKGKSAHSTLKGLTYVKGHSLVMAEIHSGRTHQIRLHLAHLGHPLIGESMHRTPPCERLAYPALHSWCLELPLAGEEPLRIVAPLPSHLKEVLMSLDFALPDTAAVGF